MKSVLVVYYSLTGTTARVAEAIAGTLDADLVRIEDRVKRRGLVGFLRTGYQALRKKSCDIDMPLTYASGYELVLFGSPTYAGGIAPGLRRFIENVRGTVRKAAYFGTGGDRKNAGVLTRLEEAVGLPRSSGLYLCDRTVKAEEMAPAVEAFCRELG